MRQPNGCAAMNSLAPSATDRSLLYEINGHMDDAEAMYKKAITLDMNDVLLKAVSAVCRAKQERKKLREQQGTTRK